jgi:hypothetical protein
MIIDDDGTGAPFLTILAMPSMTTFNESTGDAGVTRVDIWEESVLAKV